ncbi:Uu.00g048070.m01.CDS01 [Anthostomella pinea]|uniref:Uu.00g048070.m01.CDS01 n=1 Tax=Anthostomella pinea TaxID=933095 RepID=A0AAI8VBJ4_9PEZI|nr:Uu.00g048070.m01.CDS01 [Anthostomella pinea]
MSSVAAAPAKALPSMEKLDPLVSFYRPPETSGSSSSAAEDHQPLLIIIAGWTGARDAHVAKYVVRYQALYPAAQILLLRSTMKQIARPALIAPAMKHAAAVVHAAFPPVSSSSSASSSSSPCLLVHMFSNGGSSNIANLISHAVAVVSVGLPSLQRLIITPVLYALATLWSVGIALGLLPDSLSDWGRAHNHDAGNTTEVRRVYIYSPSDDMIDYRVVEAHAAEARARGFSVELERYEGSAHVAHLRKDESRYWQIVRRIVEGSGTSA